MNPSSEIFYRQKVEEIAKEIIKIIKNPSFIKEAIKNNGNFFISKRTQEKGGVQVSVSFEEGVLG